MKNSTSLKAFAVIGMIALATTACSSKKTVTDTQYKTDTSTTTSETTNTTDESIAANNAATEGDAVTRNRTDADTTNLSSLVGGSSGMGR